MQFPEEANVLLAPECLRPRVHRGSQLDEDPAELNRRRPREALETHTLRRDSHTVPTTLSVVVGRARSREHRSALLQPVQAYIFFLRLTPGRRIPRFRGRRVGPGQPGFEQCPSLPRRPPLACHLRTPARGGGGTATGASPIQMSSRRRLPWPPLAARR